MPPRPATVTLDDVPTKPRQGGKTQVLPQSKKRGERTRRAMNIDEVRSRGISTTTKAGAALIDVNKPLTDKMKLFVKHWAAGESILSASYRAGYADGGTYAYRMVAMPNILALYNAEKKLYEEASGMTRKKVMDMLIESYEHAKLAGEPASMVSAAREVGKLCGYYEPVKIKIDINNPNAPNFTRMSDSELLEVLLAGPNAAPQLEGPSGG